LLYKIAVVVCYKMFEFCLITYCGIVCSIDTQNIHFQTFHLLCFNYPMCNDKHETKCKNCVCTHTLEITRLYCSLTCKINTSSSSLCCCYIIGQISLTLFPTVTPAVIMKIASCCVQAKSKIVSISNIDKLVLGV